MQFCNNKVNMAHSAIKMVGNHAFIENYSKKERNVYIKKKAYMGFGSSYTKSCIAKF